MLGNRGDSGWRIEGGSISPDCSQQRTSGFVLCSLQPGGFGAPSDIISRPRRTLLPVTSASCGMLSVECVLLFFRYSLEVNFVKVILPLSLIIDIAT